MNLTILVPKTNVNGLNNSVKRCQIKQFSQKDVILDLKISIQLFTGDTLQTQRHKEIESERMRKIYHRNKHKICGVTILISEK